MNQPVNPMNLTLRQLRAFVAVANLRGFTAAAKDLHLTQSALSGLVKELEAGLGVRLFDRSTREVVLTRAGQELLPLAGRVLEDLRDAATRITDLTQGRRGIVRVASMELLSCTLLPQVISAFQRDYPDLEVRLADTVLEQMFARVRSGEVDLAVGPEPGPDPELDRTPLLQAPFMFVCHRRHPLARKRRITWSDLRDERFITMIRNFRSLFMNERHGWPRHLDIAPAREVALLTTALGMASAGLGVTVCPSYGAPLVHGFHLVLRPLHQPTINAEVYVFTRKGRSLSPGAETFAAFLRRFLSQAPWTRGDRAGSTLRQRKERG